MDTQQESHWSVKPILHTRYFYDVTQNYWQFYKPPLSFNGQQVFRRWTTEKRPWATKKKTSWLPKGQISEKVSVQHCNINGGQKPVEISGVCFGSLKTFFLSAKFETICRHFSKHIGYSELENTRQINIFVTVHVCDMFLRSNPDVTY